MLLTAGAVIEFVKFVQILCWIILPALLIAVGVTIFLHYRKKKINQAAAESAVAEDMPLLPTTFNHKKADGDYVLFDHTALIRQYRDRLCYSHARYTALQHDFSALETRFAALVQYASGTFLNDKNNNMENFREQLPQHLQEEINLLVQEHAAERKEMLGRLEQLGRSYQSLEQENESLLEQIGLGTADEDQKVLMENRWKEENIQLKDKLAEQEYLEDILIEKNAQIEFLQRQLEQRIKNYYQGEQQQAQQATELETFKHREAETLAECDILKTNISKREEEIRQLQTIVNENSDQLKQKDQMIESKNWLVDNLENQLADARSQYETANNLLALKETALVELQQKLLQEKSRSGLLEEKLHSGRQTFRRLYDEYSAFLDVNADQSPVIQLRSGYSSRDGEEIASN